MHFGHKEMNLKKILTMKQMSKLSSHIKDQDHIEIIAIKYKTKIKAMLQ